MTPWTHVFRRYLGAGAVGSIERRVELMALALAGVLLLQWLVGGVGLAMLDEPEAIRPGLGGEDDLQLAGLSRVTTAQREEITARPLFWISRRPEATAGAAGEGKSGSAGGRLGEVKLRGVFGSGKTAGVIVLVGEREARVLLGERLEGWELEAVHPDRVEFSRSGRRETLFLKPAQSSPARTSTTARQPTRAAVRKRAASAAAPAPANEQEKRGDSPAGQLGWGGG